MAEPDVPDSPDCSDPDHERTIPTVTTFGDNSVFPTELHDVKFPFLEACQAISTCRRIATLLQGHIEARPEMVRTAFGVRPNRTWTGGHREEYDRVWRDQRARLIGLKDHLRTTASLIAGAFDEAKLMNDTRAESRESFAENPTDFDYSRGR